MARMQSPRSARIARAAAIAALAALAASCGTTEPPRTIAEWDLFVDPRTQTPSEGVVPYALVAPLFSDYADKHRFIRLPEGEQITVDADGRWQFPVGTVLVKTFAFGERIVETRLLVHEADGWEPYVYVWNDDVTEATLTPAGRRVAVTIDRDGTPETFDYRVPSHTQCRNCHGGDGPLLPLGPRTTQMDRDGQLAHFAELGMLAADPPRGAEIVDYASTDPSLTPEQRARSYLHANCSHCHRENGGADQSGLLLNVESTDLGALGYCKLVVAAGRAAGGRRVVIHPGDPEDSVMIFRMESTEAGIKMPELPSVLSHTEGVAIVREWIASMPAEDCGLPPR